MISCPEVTKVACAIRRLIDPDRIILFSLKRDINGNPSSFKLCIVIREGDKREAERRIYSEIDSEIPFDLVLYTLPEWEKISADALSFARKIKDTGCVIDE